MTPTEARAVGSAVAEIATEVADVVQGMHRAVAVRAGACLVHDVVSDVVYSSVRAGLRAAGAVGGFGLSRTVAVSGGGLAESARGSAWLGFGQGVVGAELERRQAALAVRMSLRTADGRPAADHTGPRTGRIVVFLHGLVETERCWRTGDEAVPGFGRRLAETGWTDLYVRYPSGLAVEANGITLDEALSAALAGWPVPVTEIALVGHSMGGLVARAACASAAAAGSPWLPLLRSLVTLATPHGGAPLARGAALASSALALLPETRPLGRLLDWRSAGIRDLEKVCGTELPPSVRHTVVLATLAREPSSRLGRLVGDGMVRPASACHGAGSDAVVRRVGGVGHLAVPHHPDVWPHVRDALG